MEGKKERDPGDEKRVDYLKRALLDKSLISLPSYTVDKIVE